MLTNPPPRASDFTPVSHDLDATKGEVPLVVSAAGGGARVEIRQGDGTLVFKGKLPFGATQTWQVTTPVHVRTTDGSLTVELDGHVEGPMGAPGKDAANVYAVGN